MRLDLIHFRLRQRAPPLSLPIARHQTGDLTDREADLLKQRDHGEPLENRWDVVPAATDAGLRLDDPGSLVVAQSRALEARDRAYLADAQKFVIRPPTPLT